MIGVVPAKFGSSRCEKKNFRKFWSDLCLAEIAVHRLLAAGCSVVLVSCENNSAVKTLREKFAQESTVLVDLRPEVLASDPSTIRDVVRDLLVRYYPTKGDFGLDAVIVSLPTSPFVTTADILEALYQFRKLPKNSYLFTVSTTDFPPYNSWVSEGTTSSLDAFSVRFAFPDSEYRLTQSTRCPTTLRSNGGVVISGVEYYLHEQDHYKKYGFLLNDEKSLDIDTEFQFEIAKIYAMQKYIDPWWI